MPILGVCLGHQSIGQAFGGKVVRAPQPVHGKLTEMQPSGRKACSAASTARSRRRAITRWWSSGRACRTSLSVTAETDDGLVMGLAHKTLPVHGVQFHPESIASEHGHLMLKNFLEIAAQWNAARGRTTMH